MTGRTPTPGSESNRRRVLAFSGTFVPGYKGGGPVKSMVHILDNLPETIQVTLATSDRDMGDSEPYPNLSGRLVCRGQHEIYYLNTRSPRHWLRLLRRARRTQLDLIYTNSFFSPKFSLMPILARQLGILPSDEVLIAPRGELSPGALQIKSTKKRAFLRFAAPLVRRMDPIFQASTELEADEIRGVFPWARTIVRINSNGDAPRQSVVPSGDRARFVFLSRISETKNLRLALIALKDVSCELDFDIYGPQEDSRYWATCCQLIEELPANVRASYVGELHPTQVQDTLAHYDGLILPTLGENFGHVIAESLSAGCPVICSLHTPWTDVLRAGGGAALGSFDPALWAHEIDDRATQTSARRQASKDDALRAYVAWRHGQQMTTAVESVLDGLSPKGPDGEPTTSTQGLEPRRRVAMVTQGYQTAGGIQTTARWLTTALTGAGHEVDVYDLANSRRDPNSRRLISPASWFRSTLLSPDATDPRVIHVGSNGAEFEPLRYLRRSELTSELDHHDVIQVVAGGPALGLATTGSRTPVILLVATRVAWERASQLAETGRALAWWRGSMTRVVSLMERVALRRAAAVLVLNDEMRAYVVSAGQPNAFLAPPGVNTDRFSPAATGWTAAGYLLSVCRLSDPRKGLDRLVAAYALIRASRPHTPKMVLAGRGVISQALDDLITALSLREFIEIRSDVPEADLPGLYQGASVYVQCSHEEGLGISVIEAMASGVPVVGTDTAGTRQTIVDGETGWLIEQGSNVERLTADHVIAILDDDDTGSMAKRARERAVAVFSNDVTISRLLAVYSDIAHCDSWHH